MNGIREFLYLLGNDFEFQNIGISITLFPKEEDRSELISKYIILSAAIKRTW